MPKEAHYLMNRVILADNQAIFRAGAARVLAVEDDIRIVAQCEDASRMFAAMEAHRGTIVLFSSGIEPDILNVTAKAAETGCRTILIAENGAELPETIARSLDGMVYRNVPGADLLDCIRRVGSGQRSVQGANVTSILAQDTVGTRVRERLTPKEVQIIALVLQGCKNRQIAAQLGTKEQVIKNYLRSIYDKTGVSDRLELALFTIHHRVLADAVAKAADMLQVMTA